MGRGNRNQARGTNLTISQRDTNKRNIASYSKNFQTYIDKTYSELAEEEKAWVKEAVSGLPAGARIYEVGAGEGRTSRFLKELRFDPTISDATPEFVDLLNKNNPSSKAVEQLDCLNENISPIQDLIIANAVLLHFNNTEFEKVIQRFHRSLSPSGRLAFSVKTEAKLRKDKDPLGDRYFNPWNEEDLIKALKKNNFEQIKFVEEKENMLRCISVKS